MPGGVLRAPTLLRSQLQMQEFPWTPSGLIFARMIQNSGKLYTYDYIFIVQDATQEQPNEGDAQGREG